MKMEVQYWHQELTFTLSELSQQRVSEDCSTTPPQHGAVNVLFLYYKYGIKFSPLIPILSLRFQYHYPPFVEYPLGAQMCLGIPQSPRLIPSDYFFPEALIMSAAYAPLHPLARFSPGKQ